MFIKNLKIKNFKWFSDLSIDFAIPNWEPWSGLNIFVGENNGWKTSILEAMYFVRNKISKDIKRAWIEENEDCFIEQTFSWDIEGSIDTFVQQNKQHVFKECIYEEDWQKLFTVRRNFKESDDIKKILFRGINWEFENRSGIDAVFQSFYQISNIWANTNPENEIKFWSSTICWNLLADISEKFKLDNSEYGDFIMKFNEVFNNDSSWLQRDLNDVARETQDVLSNQFGNVTLKFKFDNPEPSILLKNIRILVNDGEETDISAKGHWLQRAVILSLLQVYAKRIIQNPNDERSITKPHFLFIDEPEMWLHPQAQKKLFDALRTLSAHHQIFITTHSENFVSLDTISNIHKTIKNNNGISLFSVNRSDVQLRENRTFWFHHHKLFFAKKAIFVEWADDINNYPIFAHDHWFSDLKNAFYMMGGCASHKKFKNLAEALWIQTFFILDIDVISKNSRAKDGFSEHIKNNIIQLSVDAQKKTPDNLLDERLTEAQKILKKQIIDDLRQEWYFILSKGAYEQYFTNIWIIEDDNKKNEVIWFLQDIDRM